MAYLNKSGLTYLIQRLDARYLGVSAITVDSSLSSTSINPVQNKVIYSALANKADSTHTHTTSLATDTGTSVITLAHGGKYKLSTGGTSVVFTMPSISVATSSAVGLMPALESDNVATQSQSTKFLRQDGTWAAPSYTSNTDTPLKVSNGVLSKETGTSDSTPVNKIKDSNNVEHDIIARLLGTSDSNVNLVPVKVTASTNSTTLVTTLQYNSNSTNILRLDDGTDTIITKEIAKDIYANHGILYYITNSTSSSKKHIYIGHCVPYYTPSSPYYINKIYFYDLLDMFDIPEPTIINFTGSLHDGIIGDFSRFTISNIKNLGYLSTDNIGIFPRCYDKNYYMFSLNSPNTSWYYVSSTTMSAVSKYSIYSRETTYSRISINTQKLGHRVLDPSDPEQTELKWQYDDGDYFLDYNNLKNKPTISSASIKLLDLTVQGMHLPKEGGSISLSNGSTLYLYVYTEDDPTVLYEEHEVPEANQYAIAYSITDSNDDTYDFIWGCTTTIADNTVTDPSIGSNGNNSMEYMENLIIDNILNDDDNNVHCICIYYNNNVDYNEYPMYDQENGYVFTDDTEHYNKLIVTYNASTKEWSIEEV